MVTERERPECAQSSYVLSKVAAKVVRTAPTTALFTSPNWETVKRQGREAAADWTGYRTTSRYFSQARSARRLKFLFCVGLTLRFAVDGRGRARLGRRRRRRARTTA